ncbi:hypothetical protein [Amycolatopsis sp. H20-H5]|uniref:hypothetical protein n=1 Tax=Amycolatopsis sp. H20-H5 TaxID=3046309 RepID=UPI002DBCA7FC|nr:hypothetical protein [Amycolatopsis sp. H20-H5]MEC3976040.1 hypothetical protein [Amycolatopsis sp. H20-H5]
MSRIKIVLPVLLAVPGLGLLSSCGLGTDSASDNPGYVTPVAVQQQAQQQPATEVVKLAATEVESLGQVLADQNGMTLYRYGKDTAKPPKSNCDNACATAWPPLLAEGRVDVSGVDQNLVGSVTRADGKKQVTVSGWPVYRFAKDNGPGKAQGQGVDGNWAAVTPTGAKAAEAGTALSAADVDGLGQVMTDQDGKTLYLFTKDSKKPSKSTCDGDCAKTWPPLLAKGDPKLSGIDPALVAKVTRTDGTEQVTVGGWPVYRYSKDTAAGEAKGHGVGTTWYAVEPNGCKVAADKKPAAPETSSSPSEVPSSSAAPSDSSGGYGSGGY